VEALAQTNLWCHPLLSAVNGDNLLNITRGAQIADSDLPVTGEEDVRRLDIFMERKFSVHLLNYGDCLINKFEQIDGRKLVELLLIQDVLLECAPLSQLLNNANVVVLVPLNAKRLDHIVDPVDLVVRILLFIRISP